jgi:anaerobic selenocysteine-containing dehydrogenase
VPAGVEVHAVQEHVRGDRHASPVEAYDSDIVPDPDLDPLGRPRESLLQPPHQRVFAPGHAGQCNLRIRETKTQAYISIRQNLERQRQAKSAPTEPHPNPTERLRAGLVARVKEASFVLIGRRHLRSNNSWFHNLPALAKGKERCTLLVHPDDAKALGLAAGARARVRSRVGVVEAPVEVSDAMMRGVVSLPHGFGHDAAGAQLGVAAKRPGVNSNALTDETLIDALSGNAVLNGIPVEISAA